MGTGAAALVSVGVPVYNGESTLARALESLLAQDYPALEIVISDNGSTDGTPEICAAFSQRDGRVKYFRSARNRGASWNFNRVFELATGEFFMWAAHDDERHARFVSACVRRLQECPDAVLCQTHTAMFIEGRGNEQLCTARLDPFEHVHGIAARYRTTLEQFPATGFYGMYRSSAIRKTRLFQHHVATDVAFIQELSIYGDFVQVPEVLFTYVGRRHWNTVDQDYRAIYGRDKKPRWYLPFMVLFMSHFRRMVNSSIDGPTKLRLTGILIAHQAKQLIVKASVKMVGRLCPTQHQEAVGKAIYYRFLHRTTVTVNSPDLFLERVIKPTLGWPRFP